MLPRSVRSLLPVFLLSPAAMPAQSTADAGDLSFVRGQLEHMRNVVRDNYYPAAKVTDEFFARCAATDKAVARAHSLSEAYGLIADTFAALDPRIRFYPPRRANRVDYSWEWTLIGSAAYVTQIDRTGDAAKQGLRLGDRILSIEGNPLGRDNFQQLYYLFSTLSPRPGLQVQVQAPGGEPRALAIASTVRPQRRIRNNARVYTKEEHRRFDEMADPKSHVRRVGKVVVWQAHEVRLGHHAVGQGLKLIEGATGLVLDLRGQYVSNHEGALRLVDGLFTEAFTVGVVEREGLDYKLGASGDRGAFAGTLLVLVDARTAGYAEVVARLIQQRQRGVIIGDQTMGRVFDETFFSIAQGFPFNFNMGGISVPTGEAVMTDGASFDSRGVPPDYQLLPTPADLAARRDVVMSKALALLKETLSPEDAYKLFPHYEDVDDDYDH